MRALSDMRPKVSTEVIAAVIPQLHFFVCSGHEVSGFAVVQLMGYTPQKMGGQQAAAPSCLGLTSKVLRRCIRPRDAEQMSCGEHKYDHPALSFPL